MLELHNIVKDYVSSNNVTRALKGISINFRQTEFVSILGPSGCGKTTTLNIIGGLDRYTSGDLLIKGKSTKNYKDPDWDSYRNHCIGFVFQTYNLIQHLTILGNVELALTIAGVSKEERQKRALDALDKVGLTNEAKKKPNQLSGGQMQRVAIARALVNDPEIVLADEPTGALDSETSIQIMELLKEVAKDRLVIMVTHNPELAEQYSSRIVRMKDGQIIDDSNPYEKVEQYIEKPENNRKTKMNFATTFKLSAKNLFSKRKRTALVCIAGSIGIIGVSAVLAVTTGVRSYIHSMQDDMLSGNPIQISETSMDLTTLMNFASNATKRDAVEKSIQDGKINVDYMIAYLADTRNKFESSLTKNDITANYVRYLEQMPKEKYSAMKEKYDINHKFNIFTDITFTKEQDGQQVGKHVNQVSLKEVEDIYVSIIKGTKFAQYASMIPLFTSTFDTMPSSESYVNQQYDILNKDGYFPKADNEMMLVVDKKQSLTDLFLAQAGYYTQGEFVDVVTKYANGETDDEKPLEPSSFDFDKLTNKQYYLYEDNDLFKESAIGIGFENYISSYHPEYYESVHKVNPFKYDYKGHFRNDETLPENRKPIKITAIVKAKENVQYGCLKTGFVVSEQLEKKMIEIDKASNIGNYLVNPMTGISQVFDPKSYESQEKYVIATDKIKADLKAAETAFFTSAYFPPEIQPIMLKLLESTTLISLSTYDFTENWDVSTLPEEFKPKNVSTLGTAISVGTVSETVASSEILKSLSGSFDLSSQIESAARSVGANPIANEISIYPKSFDEKKLVTDYLDAWNGDGTITVTLEDGTVLPIDRDARANVKYSDNLEIVIKLINTMINIISIALICFTSLSLVVSTVMIGIITYVSVVERVKEIGIIRSLGGRKFDVSNLFNVETFIIGGISGLFGIAVTYFLSFIINIVINGMAKVGAIVTLPWYLAIAVLGVSILLTLISGLIPARAAAHKDPVIALRSNE